MFALTLLLFYAWLALAATDKNPGQGHMQAPTARTRNGTYSGIHIKGFSQDLFLGIPYAKAPRLRNPEPLTDSWKGVRDATSLGHACYTATPPEFLEQLGFTMSEDCLNLSILRPAGLKPGQKVPVAVWIHGGSFIEGLGHGRSNNASYLLKASVENEMPIIFVDINYRLAFFGFPGGKDAEEAGILNLGLKDQRMALRWVQENIAAFGGDPNKVTLWGQSAGAMSIGYQIMAYGGEGAEKLFRGGILVSGSPSYVTNCWYPDHPNPVQAYNEMLTMTGCTDAESRLDCLRRAPIDVMFNVSTTYARASLAFWPTIDGDLIRGPPTFEMEAGRVAPVSILTGTNNDEGLLSAQGYAALVPNEEVLRQSIPLIMPLARPSTISEVLSLYPADGPSPPYSVPMDGPFCAALEAAGHVCGSQYRRLAAMFGDLMFMSGRRYMARAWAGRGLDAWAYRFDTNPTSFPITENKLTPGFATHSTEYAYFFGLPPGFDLLGWNPGVVDVGSHVELSRGIVDKLISYIYAGDPNSFKNSNVPEWPVYSLDNPTDMVFNATEADNQLNIHVESDTWRQDQLQVWHKYPIELSYGCDRMS